MSVPHPERVTSNMVRKGRRLHRENRVHRITGGEVWAVQGDHGLYLPAVAGPYATCPCPHHGACSHAQAIREAQRSGNISEITLDELLALHDSQDGAA